MKRWTVIEWNDDSRLLSFDEWRQALSNVHRSTKHNLGQWKLEIDIK